MAITELATSNNSAVLALLRACAVIG